MTAAETEQMPPLRCTKCDAEIAVNAEIYVAGCRDGKDPRWELCISCFDGLSTFIKKLDKDVSRCDGCGALLFDQEKTAFLDIEALQLRDDGALYDTRLRNGRRKYMLQEAKDLCPECWGKVREFMGLSR
jgi:phage FluMu protein Com